jgi:hypothetical protein
VTYFPPLTLPPQTGPGEMLVSWTSLGGAGHLRLGQFMQGVSKTMNVVALDGTTGLAGE